MAGRLLPRETFLEVVRHAPLVSMDLIVRDAEGAVLVGLRRNRPARGSWFVPGGCVRKNERFEAAFARITEAELGFAVPRDQARFVGAFEHFYEDNAGERPGFGTHYVVLAHELKLPRLELPADQHSDCRWLQPAALLADPAVHRYTKDYFSAARC